MARKKKNLKDINEHEFTHSCLQDPTLKRASLDEHMLQENQQHTKEQQAQDKQQQQHEQQQPHNSDSEIMDVKLKNLQVDKNKSNLFLIKSYSFIDKTNAKRPKNLNVKTKLEEFEKFHTLMLDQASPSSPTKENLEKSENIVDKEKSEKLKKTEKIKKLEKLEKPKKPPKLKKLKKSKSSYESTEHLQEFQDILRKPSIILENEVKLTSTPRRPQSMPVAQSQHKPVMKSKTLDDLETNHIKRDSFIRHSLQSIRRSFSSSKKYNQHNISFTSSSSSSSSSASSGSDNSGKLSKSKTKDIGNLKDVEDHNDLIMEEEEAEQQQDKRSCNIVITVNDVLTLEEPSNHPCANNNNNHLKDSILKSASLSTASSSAAAVPKVAAQPAAAGSSLAHMDALAVLKEEDEKDLLNNNSNNNSSPCVGSEQRSTSSVSTLAQLQNTDSVTPMAPLQTHTECHSVQCLNSLESDFKSSSSSSSPPQISKRVFQHQLSTPESLQSTSIGCATSSEYSSARSLKHSSTSLVPLQTLHSSSSLRSISPSRRSASSNSSSTAKHEQSPAAATAAAAATATTSTTPPEKEKKRKEVSSSRVKKFQRHFSQVSKDEKLINYFSCALVSDILLQGHLYITDHHFAFYSNVFGYVTKVVIPTSSVTKISKEKTAKIIPNAVGVATADERHVFGSFISREAAFRLMSSVCPPLGIVEILPKDPGQIEISEEYSIEDDSSCSISGNESPAQTTDMLNSTNHSNDTSQTILRRSVGTSNLSIADSTNDMLRHSDIPSNAKTATTTASLRASAPAAYVNGNGGVMNLIGLKSVLQPALPTAGLESNLTIIAGCTSSTTSATSTPTPSTSSSPTTVMNLPNSKANQVMNVFKSVSDKIMVNMKFPTEIHVVYLGVMLTLLLAIFSIFLLYRILDIEAKTSSYRSPAEFNWRSGNDDDIFNEALRFQKQLQLKSTEEAQNILKTNLEQIAKVRRSLETLSMLIHDRSSSFVANSNIDDSDD